MTRDVVDVVPAAGRSGANRPSIDRIDEPGGFIITKPIESVMPTGRRSGWRRRDLLAALGSGTLTGTAGCLNAVGGGNENATTGNGNASGNRSPYTKVYEETVDSVVLIRVSGAQGRGGLGTGFVHDGYLITNQHITQGRSTAAVQFSRDEWQEASLVGEDAYADLAVLDADPPEYAGSLSFLDRYPAVGTEVVAIGNPFGLDSSVSSGIVSGVHRSLQNPSGVTIPDAIQTDAAVNPGNSGGPLVTLDGAIAGVISAGGGDNIAFAVSTALARRVVPALIENGEYDAPYLGVGTIPMTPAIAEANGLEEPTGVYVNQVAPNGPAAGVLRGSTGRTTVSDTTVPTGGDVLVSLAEQSIGTPSELSSTIALDLSPDETTTVTVRRDGDEVTVDLPVGTRPPASTGSGGGDGSDGTGGT